MSEEEEVNEILVCEDRYETYRLGYKRGVDRGYDVAHQQEEDVRGSLEERLEYVAGKHKELFYIGEMKDNKITQLEVEVERLQAIISKQEGDILDRKLKEVERDGRNT